MNTQIQTPIFVLPDQYDVVGSGEMPTEPVQVGMWWVVPADQYPKKIPKEATQRLFEFLKTGTPCIGFVIADDMAKIEYEREQEKKKQELTKKIVTVGAISAAAPLILPVIGMGLGLAAMVFGLCAYDPMLIAVLEDRRWVCLDSWFD
jgi:hypothetical protein